MVRLKVSEYVIDLKIFACFNSNMVRLKGNFEQKTSGRPQFQFQYGTIKR